MSYGLTVSELIIGRRFEKNFSVDVLKCETVGCGIFHVTKGRRANSVYFVKKVKTNTGLIDKFILDRNFKCDTVLTFQFTELAESVYSKVRPRARLTPENDSASPIDWCPLQCIALFFSFLLFRKSFELICSRFKWAILSSFGNTLKIFINNSDSTRWNWSTHFILNLIKYWLLIGFYACILHLITSFCIDLHDAIAGRHNSVESEYQKKIAAKSYLTSVRFLFDF